MNDFAVSVRKCPVVIVAAAVLGCLLVLPPAAADAAQKGLVVTPLEDDFGGGSAPGYDPHSGNSGQVSPGREASAQLPPDGEIRGGTSTDAGGHGALPPQTELPSYKDGMVMAYLVELMRKQNKPCPSGATPPVPPSLVFSEPLCRVAEAVGNGSEFPPAYESQGIYASHWRMFSAPNQPAQQVATRLRAEHCEALLEPYTHIGAWLGPQGWRIVLATLTNRPDPVLNPDTGLPEEEGAAPAVPGATAKETVPGQGAGPAAPASVPVSTPATAPAAVAGTLASPAPAPAQAQAAPVAQPGTDPGAQPVPMTRTPSFADSGDRIYGQEARAMFQLINELRSKGGSCLGKPVKTAAPLSFDSILQAAAEKSAAEAAAKGSFNTAPGSSQDAIQGTENYPGAKVAKLYGISSPPASTMVDVWMVSPPRCETLLSQDYDDIGVAYDGRYWIVLMGQRARGVPSPEIPASKRNQAASQGL